MEGQGSTKQGSRENPKKLKREISKVGKEVKEGVYVKRRESIRQHERDGCLILRIEERGLAKRRSTEPKKNGKRVSKDKVENPLQ